MSSLYDSSDVYDVDSYSYDSWPLRSAASSGTSSSVVSALRTTFASGVAAGEGGETSTWLRTVPKSASGSGGATAGDNADYLRTVPRVVVAIGTGTSFSYGATSQLRSATGSAIGSSSIVSFATLFRTASSSTAGSLDVALWENRGQKLKGKVILQPYWVDAKAKYIPR